MQAHKSANSEWEHVDSELQIYFSVSVTSVANMNRQEDLRNLGNHREVPSQNLKDPRKNRIVLQGTGD